MRTHYGRGPSRAKTYVIDDIIVCVLRNGFTAHEQTIVEGGDSDKVIGMRREFQHLMAERYKGAIEITTPAQGIAEAAEPD